MNRPNVLFILTDDQRYDTINALGNEDIITPNMDKLVNSGTAFTQAHIPGGTCGAICMPSRAMIHTGRTLMHLQDDGQIIPLKHKLMGETFGDYGYFRFGCGKWHNSPAAFTRSFNAGENAFFGGMWDHWNVPVCSYDATGEYDNVIDFTADFHRNNQIMKIHCDRFNPGIHSSQLLTDTAIGALDKINNEHPFFMYLAYLAPHDPRTMPKQFEDMYNPDKIKLPDNFNTNHFEFGIHDIRDELLASYPRNEKEIQKHIAQYYGMITHLDFEIGRLMDELERRGILDDTIIILAGDNGLAVGCHGLMGKQNLYDHSIRVPLIFSGAGIPKGKKIDNYVYLLDIYPTLCELLDMENPETSEGISFAEMFANPAKRTREDLYFVYTSLIRGVKDDRFKLISYRDRKQLFDLSTDPNEINNLVDNSTYSGHVTKLESIMSNYRKTWEDVPNIHTDEFWK